MKKLNEFLMTFVTALLLCVILTVSVVKAPPEEPTEGELEDTEIVGDWNWQVKAYVWGHWSWVPGSNYKFIEWISAGSRYATYGVFIEGDFWYQWERDSYSFNETDPGIIIWHHSYTLCNHIRGRTYSKFYNVIGQHWDALTEWADIII